MKKRLIVLAGMILMLLCLTSCQKSEENPGNLIYGVECIIFSCPDGTYYMIEKPDVNDLKTWDARAL